MIGWISDSYCNIKPLCSGMGEVVLARTSPTLLPPSPRTVLSLSCSKVSQCIIVVTSTVRVKTQRPYIVKGIWYSDWLEVSGNVWELTIFLWLYKGHEIFGNMQLLSLLPTLAADPFSSFLGTQITRFSCFCSTLLCSYHCLPINVSVITFIQGICYTRRLIVVLLLISILHYLLNSTH